MNWMPVASKMPFFGTFVNARSIIPSVRASR
jgi:hypothetical protein